MAEVPGDVLGEILSRLPAESLFRFRAVCKAWRRIIDDPSFIKSHTINQLHSHSTLLITVSNGGNRLYSLSLDSLDCADGTIDVTPFKQLIHRGVPRLRYYLPLASCSGLILIYNRNINENWVVWNPLTQKFHKLPQLNSDLMRSGYYEYNGSRGVGFGYDCGGDDYKVVRIDGVHRQGMTVYRTLVYSLKLGFWRMVKDCPCQTLLGLGVFLNGALHWRSRDRIVVFDLVTEDYSQLPRPPIPNIPEREHLDALGGCLVLSCFHYKWKRLDGWIMKEYGVEKSWMKLFSMEEQDNTVYISLRPVAYLRSKRQVILQYFQGFLCFDLENNSVKKVTFDGVVRISCSQFSPGSLFRPDDVGRNSASVAAKRTAGVKRKMKRKRADTSLKILCKKC